MATSTSTDTDLDLAVEEHRELLWQALAGAVITRVDGRRLTLDDGSVLIFDCLTAVEALPGIEMTHVGTSASLVSAGGFGGTALRATPDPRFGRPIRCSLTTAQK